MNKMGATARRQVRSVGLSLGFCFALLLTGPHRASARTGLKQFDVFVGYDGIVPAANWFPVVCEVYNDGPGFNAVFELIPGQFNEGQTRRYSVELPSGTRKRFVIPTYCASSHSASWNARLWDAKGGLRDEKTGLQPKNLLARGAPLLGAMGRSITWQPVFPSVPRNRANLQPMAARLQPGHFPDNPIALEGLSAIYLNSEKALDLKVEQVNALLGWLSAGGHLIVGIEQPADLKAALWLNDLLPCDLTAVGTMNGPPDLTKWVKESAAKLNLFDEFSRPPSARSPAARTPNFPTLKPDPVFEQAVMQVATGVLRDGQVVLAGPNAPLIIAAPRGRGRVTVLTFSPEREPFRSWGQRDYFWARLLEVPASWFTQTDHRNYGVWGVDGVFGAMIDTKQVRKLPVGWLLLLLVVYLVVIGPMDQFVLKRLNRQMWTWLTFPAYVLLFSGLIYFIGYKLRAGDIEWNELHVVDILAGGKTVALRGHSFGSLYSPANARYPLAGTLPFATLRGEYTGGFGGGQESSRGVIEQRDNQFRAEVAVPVWTSQLYVGAWWNSLKTSPLTLSVTRQGSDWQVKVENQLPYRLHFTALILQNRFYEVGEIAGRETKTLLLSPRQGRLLGDFVRQYGGQFQNVVQQRGRALGSEQASRLGDAPRCAMAASFVSLLNDPQNYWLFMGPAHFDLAPQAERGDAILLAWTGGHSLINPLNQFTPRRSRTDTLLRLSVPLKPST